MALLNTATGRVFIVEFLDVQNIDDFVTPCSLVDYPPTRIHGVIQMFCSLSSSSSSSTFLTSQQFSLLSKQYSLTAQALLIHCFAKNFQMYGMHSALLLSALKYTEHSRYQSVSICRAVYVGSYHLWITQNGTA